MSTGRNTTTRDRHRRIIARTQPPCALCGQAIDYSLKWPHPDSYVVDHIHPDARGGPDALSNKQAAHAHCNRAKGDTMPAREYATERTW